MVADVYGVIDLWEFTVLMKSWYDDEIDLSKCDDCDFDCWTHQYCKHDKKD